MPGKITRAARSYKKKWLTRYAHPRGGRKMRTLKPGKNFSKKVKAVIQKTSEHKIIGLMTSGASPMTQYRLLQNSISTDIFPNWVTATSTVHMPVPTVYTWLYPQLPQGDDKQTRIGNKITSLFAKMRLRFYDYLYVPEGDQFYSENAIFVHEIVATKGGFGDQGDKLIDSVGTYMYANWGQSSSSMKNEVMQQLARPRPSLDFEYLGFYIRKSHRVQLPGVMERTSTSVGNVVNTSPNPKYVNIKAGKKSLRYQANGDYLPSNTNVLIVIVNPTPWKVYVDFENYMSFIDD